MKYKIKIDNKMRSMGEEDNGKIKINVKLSKKYTTSGKLNKHRYPGVADTILHEITHARHPKMHEKTVYKKTRLAIKKMGKKAKKKLYSMLPR
jgi:hypothetical protein